MTFRQNRFIFYLILILILLSGPVTVINNSNISGVQLGSVEFYNILQRMLGLIAFSLVTIQIASGAVMKKIWVQVLGAQGFRLHIILGISTLAAVLLHPLMYLFMGYKLGILSDLLLPDLSDRNAIFESFGRLALALLLVTITAGYFRTKPIFRRIWRKIHVINYLIYVFIVLHASGIGTDFTTFPFVIVYVFSIPLVAASFAQRMYSFYQTAGLS